jgi:hypothetical protein
VSDYTPSILKMVDGKGRGKGGSGKWEIVAGVQIAKGKGQSHS